MEPFRQSSSKATVRWLFAQTRHAGVWVALAAGLGFLVGLLMIGQAVFLARIIHGAFLAGRTARDLLPSFLGLAAVIVGRAAAGWAREAVGFRAGARVREKVHQTLWDHITRLGPLYSGSQASGLLASRIMENVEGLHDFFAHYLPQLALAVMVPAAILWRVFPLSWAAGALLLVTAPLIPLFMVLIGMGVESVTQRHYRSLARMSAHFLDVLQGLATLKLYDRSRDEASRVARVSRNFRRRSMGVLRVAFLSSAVLEFFACLSIALVAVYLGLGYLGYLQFGAYGRTLSLEQGLFILLLAPDFYLPLRELGTYYHARADALGATEGILEILDRRPLDGSRSATAAPPNGGHRIRFDRVGAVYENGRAPALTDVSFELRPAEWVVLTGPSGAGKTTVLNLLLKFAPAQQGRILFDGMPLDAIDTVQWRRRLAWIGQEPVLFHGTVRENIRLGRPEAAPAEVEAAARAARVTDFARLLPAGLETRVGEHGYGLSRGQAQRVAMARAFLKNAPILLLDEPTASLDPENERLVLDAIGALSRGRTVLMLTHRLGSVRHADRILVMESGRMVEEGNYAELMAAKGVFYRLSTATTESDRHA